ncbi:MAG TPA: PLP-dependent aminotransferase family protein, partial [Gammaproteobacteria bacterium]|nr:PLP-dependent aminotransferase family protein [Gammaproteobacteria bacterium]
ETHRVRACWFMTSFQNPLGATMPDDKKRDLVRLLRSRGVPLIEDDVYAELYFGARRPPPAKAFDDRGLVLHCGSLSKSLAPGYRIGWVAAGQLARDVQRRKIMTSRSTSIPVQEGIAQALKGGGYDAHLKSLRRALAAQQTSMLDSLRKHWRGHYRVTRPEGGNSCGSSYQTKSTLSTSTAVPWSTGSASHQDPSFRRAVSSETLCV